MSNWHLLRVMVLKEFRTTFRERAQMRGLVISMILMLVVIGASLYRVTRRAHFYPGTVATGRSATAFAPAPPREVNAQEQVALHWAAIAIAAGIGFFFSSGYLIAAILATFVGEKEAKTLEILLASPIPDRTLYALKAVSVLLPSAVLGYALAALASILACALVPGDAIPLSWDALPYALIFSAPVLVLLQLWFVGLGAAISAKAETMKGAGQSLGAVFVVLIFGSGYGVPLLLQFVPTLWRPLDTIGRFWMGQAFAIQYALVVLVLSLPAVLFLALGRACFRRDRMLT